ncbi:MAG: hypothetical protein RIE08_00135 [Acidimicrobiales bacterium]
MNLPRFETRALAIGAAVLLALAVPVGVVSVLVADELSSSAWVAVPFALIVAAAALSGAVTARRAISAPTLHAGAAAALAYLVVVVVAVIRWAADSGEVTWTGVFAGAAVIVSAGVIGALWGERKRT